MARDVSIPNADDAVTSGFEQLCARGVVALSVTPVMRIALELHDEPLGDTIEVHDKAVQDVLAAELQAEHTAVAQQRPRMAFGWSRGTAKRT